MNILNTIISFNTGGAEKLLCDLLNNWNRKEDNVFLCIINNDYSKELLSTITCQSRIVCLNREPDKMNFKFLIQYLNLIKRLKINKIHCHDKESVFVSSVVKIFFSDIDLYHTIHDIPIYRELSIFYLLLDKLFVKNIIAISNSVKKEILVRGVKESKVKIIYNGIDFSKFKQHSEQKNEKINIGCVARIKPLKKGQDILIQAINLLVKVYPNIKCFFAGTYESKDQNEMNNLVTMVENLNLENNVEFLGNINDIPMFLNNMDIFVLPSRFEGFGISIIEAMAAKVRVIASNIDGPKEIIVNNNFGYLFKSEDYNDLYLNLVKVITEDSRKNKIKETYNYAFQNFSIDKMISNLYILYNS